MERIARKIALVGGPGVGKSTLVDTYRSNPRVVVSEEAARAFFMAHPDISDRFSVDVQGQIQERAMANEQNVSASSAVVICDRSVLDAAVYTYAMGDREGATQLLAKVEAWLPTYHKIFLLDPRDVKYETDDVRQEDEATRQQLHDAFVEFFEAHGIDYELLSGTVEERMEKINQIINE